MREHWDECPSVFDLGWDLSPRPSLKGRGLVRLRNKFCVQGCFGYGGFSFSPLGETGEGFGCEQITTRTMQVTRKHWDECPSVFDL